MRKDAPAASSETVDTEMNEKFGLMKRPWGVFYAKEKATGKQQSLHTSDRQEARRLLHSMNEAHRDPMVSRQIARAYLCAADPEAKTRTWQHVMDDIILDKKDKTLHRWINANKDKAFKRIKKLPLVETRADDLKAVLRGGTVSTNVYLRRLHNHALNMRWLLEPVLVKKLWPKVEYKEKRAITLEEHRRIVARETNVERRLFYELLWQLGGSQSDIALLRAENINWQERVIYYYRAKTGTLSKLSLDPEHEPILNQLPSSGPLFPYLASVREADRATEFRQRCQGLGISGVTLHSYPSERIRSSRCFLAARRQESQSDKFSTQLRLPVASVAALTSRPAGRRVPPARRPHFRRRNCHAGSGSGPGRIDGTVSMSRHQLHGAVAGTAPRRSLVSRHTRTAE
jgi:integrase